MLSSKMPFMGGRWRHELDVGQPGWPVGIMDMETRGLLAMGMACCPDIPCCPAPSKPCGCPETAEVGIMPFSPTALPFPACKHSIFQSQVTSEVNSLERILCFWLEG